MALVTCGECGGDGVHDHGDDGEVLCLKCQGSGLTEETIMERTAMTNPLYTPRLSEAEQDLFSQCCDRITTELTELERAYGHAIEVFVPTGEKGHDLAREIAKHKESGQLDPDKVTHAPSAIDVLAYMRERLGVR